MLVVGENSYISISDADNLIKQTYTKDKVERKYWESLDDEDKETLLISTTNAFENSNFCYKGQKVDSTQKLEWPRIIDGQQVDCPDSIKLGLIEQFMNDSSNSVIEELKLREYGIKSFQDGSGAKIEFDSDVTSKYSAKNKYGIYDAIYFKYISKYVLTWI